MEHTKAYQEFKKNGNTKFVRYSEGAEIQKVSMKDEQAVGKIVIEKTDKVTGKPIVNTYSEPYLCIRKVPKNFPMMAQLVEKNMMDRATFLEQALTAHNRLP